MSRKLEMEYLIPGKPEEVWRLLTEAEGLTRWFAPDAKVTPGPGGSVFLSWGEGMAGEGKIHLWEPNRAFGWTEGSANPKLVEFFLEGSGGQTKLRLVQSGFGEGASFDDEYDAVNGGWRTFFEIMVHSLRHHGFAPYTQVHQTTMIAGARQDVIAQVSTMLGFRAHLGAISVEAPFVAELPGLGLIEGRRLDPDKPGYFLLRLDNWDNSIVALFFEVFGESLALTQQWFLYGKAREHAEELRTQLKHWMATLSAGKSAQ